MGEGADDIFSTLPLTAEERKVYNTVISKLESQFIIKRKVIFELAKVNQGIQHENEPVDAFITDVQTLAQHYSYGALHDETHCSWPKRQSIVREIVVGFKFNTVESSKSSHTQGAGTSKGYRF